MILQYFILTLILLIWITLNETDQETRFYIEYSSCNRFALCEIFFQKFLRVFHFDGDDDEDEMHINSKKKLVLIRKENWSSVWKSDNCDNHDYKWCKRE